MALPRCIFAGVFAVLLAAGCMADLEGLEIYWGDGPRCAADSDCEWPSVCRFGCTDEGVCDDNLDCGLGDECRLRSPHGDTQVSRTTCEAAFCTSDHECGPRQTCRASSGWFSAEEETPTCGNDSVCISSADCSEHEECRVRSGDAWASRPTCEPWMCEHDVDCPPHALCNGSECGGGWVVACESDDDCPESASCCYFGDHPDPELDRPTCSC